MKINAKQFQKELINFRELYTSKRFWRLDEKHRDGAKNGITHAFLALDDTPEEMQRMEMAFFGFMQEYTMREAYMAPVIAF